MSSTDLLISNEEKAKILADLKAEQAPVEARLQVMEAAAFAALFEGRYAQFAVEMRNWDETAHKLAIPRANPVRNWLKNARDLNPAVD